MEFKNATEFISVFGPCSASKRMAQALGLSIHSYQRRAIKCGITPPSNVEPIPGLDHLPGLPDFATSRTWAGGTWYRIDCEQSADSPGYRSLLIHLSQQSADRATEPEITHAEEDS